MNRIVLITGATAGIGRATAIAFAGEGDHLVITGRRHERLKSLKEELKEKFQAKVFDLAFDIRKKDDVENALSKLPESWRNIDILVNNAGLASGLDPVHEADTDDWETMIDTNIKGLLYITRMVTPWMMDRSKGQVINVGSIAGKEVYPNGNVYSATKHAVDALTKGMRMDFLRHGIRVTQVAPGAVETEFSLVRFKGDEERARKVYQGYHPLEPGDVANIILFAANQPEHVNINDIVVMPAAQANAMIFDKK